MFGEDTGCLTASRHQRARMKGGVWSYDGEKGIVRRSEFLLS